MKLRTAFILVSYLFSVTTLCAQNTTLQSRISDFLKNKKATVGVSVLTERGDTLLYNNNLRYPLLSVFKFHIALAVLDKMDHAGTPLDSILHISSSQLQKNTYSPLRDKYPNQDINISLRDLLKYSVSLSDNNACDILIDYAGGISKVDSYIRKLGIKNFHLSETENTMHQDPERRLITIGVTRQKQPGCFSLQIQKRCLPTITKSFSQKSCWVQLLAQIS